MGITLSVAPLSLAAEIQKVVDNQMPGAVQVPTAPLISG